MKRILMTLVAAVAVVVSTAQAGAVADTLPYLSSLRSEILEQMTVASNNIASTNNVRGNKKLLTTLKVALKTVDRTKTNYVSGSKSLGVLNKSLSRSLASNDFNPIIQSTFEVYVNDLIDVYENLDDRVDSTYPGRARTAAEKSILRLYNYLNNADTNSNFVRALAALSKASTTALVTEKLVVKAENAPPPPASFKATITGAILGTFNFVPKPAQAIGVVYNIANDTLQISGVNGTVSGSGFNTATTVRTLTIIIPNVQDGTHTYTIGNAPGNAAALYIVSKGGIGGIIAADGYTSSTGTLTITANKATKTAVGSFSFSSPGENTATTASTSNGSFSVVWTQ